MEILIGMHIVEAREYLYWNQQKELICMTGNPRRDFFQTNQVECFVDDQCRVRKVISPT